MVDYNTAKLKIPGGRYFYNTDVNMWQDGQTGQLLGPVPRGQYRTPLTPDKEGMNIADCTGNGMASAVPGTTKQAAACGPRMVTGGSCARCNYHNPDCEYPEGGSYVCFNCR